MKNVLVSILGSLYLMSSIFPVLSSQVNTELQTLNRSKMALQQFQAELDDAQLDQLILGRSFFTIPWVEAPAATSARDGLGPLYNANSCAACHRNLGGGNAINQSGSVDRSIVFALSAYQTSGTNTNYGNQLAINGIRGVPFEGQITSSLESQTFTYPDGQSIKLYRPNFTLNNLNYGELEASANARRSPALVGLGLIEQIPEWQILSRADVDDRDNDGISGKVNRVWSIQHRKIMPGRYGWKASTVSVIEQTAKAAINDMGLTSDWYPQESCTNKQTACSKAYKSQSLDLPFPRLQAISNYLKGLRLPDTGPLSTSAKALFRDTGCQACHQIDYRLPDGKIINPYSDFLLHDMGEGLADSGPHALAREWRTPPLWGIGIAKTLNKNAGFLHDGRATSLEQAILWHDGEARMSRQRFIQLKQSDRQHLISFLENL